MTMLRGTFSNEQIESVCSHVDIIDSIIGNIDSSDGDPEESARLLRHLRAESRLLVQSADNVQITWIGDGIVPALKETAPCAVTSTTTAS